ncbi:major capsid protein [Chicken microvirus mg7_1]|nr:major capsid protein [Chicken microvirus mg7_1]
MAKNNIMSLVKARNKTSRSGYDLSKRIAFSTKPGELHPIWWRNVFPGDHWEFDLNSFMRTAPVATASQGRLRYYYDFFFVPMEQLWQFFPTFITQMNDNKQHSNGLLKSQNPNLDGTLPSFTMGDFSAYTNALNSSSYKTNMFGFSRVALSRRLFNYLTGPRFNSDGSLIGGSTGLVPHSLLPWAAYQKIYADYFRYTQWETVNPATFNFNFMKGSGDTELADYTSTITSNDFLRNETIFDMRYCNYQKDLFHGLLPTSQFGEEAAVPLTFSAASKVDINHPLFQLSKPLGNKTIGATFSPNETNTLSYLGATDSSSANPIVNINGSLIYDSSSAFGSLPILLLRQYESYQKWKEISLAAEEDYKSQLEAHWGVSVSEYLSGMVRYLGGISGNVNVNEVVNQTLTDAEANIRGKGLDSANGKITFDFKGEYGILMIIQHSLPLLDYNTSGYHLESTMIHAEDYPIPELDSIGMEQLPSYYLSTASSVFPNVSLIGYMPRYCQFKTDYDVVFGAFRSSLKNWVLPYDDSDVIDANNSSMTPDDNPNVGLQGSYLRYQFFKCNPHIVDDMFASVMDDTPETDPLWFWCYLNIRVTRSLDRNGLPY